MPPPAKVLLSPAAQTRRDESLAMAKFKTDEGPKGLVEYLRLADERATTQAGREPTRDELDAAAKSMAFERPLTFHVADTVTTRPLGEYAQKTEPPARPEIFFGLLWDGIKTGVYHFDKSDGSFSLNKIIDDTVAGFEGFGS